MHRLSRRALGCPAAKEICHQRVRELPPLYTCVSYSTAEGIMKAIALLLNANSEGLPKGGI